MRRTAVPPTGVERRLDPDQFIVSKTDVKGVITYANDVFCRIAGYAEHEVLGAPHNLIRHPDMPRCVFKLLWDTIATGQEVFAYVVNLAATGDHYWVFAHVTPSYDRSGRIVGYHSNRRAPDPAAVAAVLPVYAALRAEEAGHPHSADGLAASTALLTSVLQGAGQSYDEFVWSITP
jgi:PAS domain S-box-containing protein